jgi:hypothetical protein
MKLLVLLASFSSAAANFKISRGALSDHQAALIRAQIEAGAAVILSDGTLGKYFGGVEDGHAIPAKLARGSVMEHQDKHADGAPVEDEVNILYAGVGGQPTFTLRDLRSGKEHAILLEAGTHISYENKFYTHRLDGLEKWERALLGPASLRDGVLQAVGGEGWCDGPYSFTPAEETYPGSDSEGYNCDVPDGVPYGQRVSFNGGPVSPCCKIVDGNTQHPDSSTCPDGSSCLIGYEIYEDRRRGLKFGYHHHHKKDPVTEWGCCYCDTDTPNWNNNAEQCQGDGP